MDYNKTPRHCEAAYQVRPKQSQFRDYSRLCRTRRRVVAPLGLLAMTIFLMFFSTVFSPLSSAKEEIRVVATTKTFASLVEAVGGEYVKVSYVAPPSQNVHFIEPRPSDVLRLSKADLFVHAGLDLELWRYPLAEASGKPALMTGGARELDLSKGIRLLEVPWEAPNRARGDIHIYGNPHYWLHPENGKIMARTIYEKLAEIAPEHQEEFKKNLDRFLKALDQKIDDWQKKMASFKGRPILAYHNSWPYFAEFTGLRIVAFVETKPGIPPTPKHLSKLMQIMKEDSIEIMIKEPYFEDRSPKKLAQQTGAEVLILGQGVGEIKEAGDFVSLFEANIDRLVTAFSKGGNHE